MHINRITLDLIDDALVAARFGEQTTEAMDKALEALRKVGENTATDEQLDAARAAHRMGDDLEIDDDAAVSEADDGYWVQAWIWVRKENDDG